MTEAFLQMLWKNKMFDIQNLTTTSGEKITVLNPGTMNTDSGPDFFNARIKIGNTIWAGNIEIHLKSSDWKRHGHQNDEAYNNVILHVVAENDENTAVVKNGRVLYELIIRDAERLYNNYRKLLSLNLAVPCQNKLMLISEIDKKLWLTALASERLEQKTIFFEDILHSTVNHWEETFYRAIATQFGFKTNAQPFSALAKTLPLSILAHYKNNIFQLEALLFGQAGFLEKPDKNPDDYFLKLQSEYQFLRQKHQLKPIPAYVWKFMRLRPLNFPTVRIAQFAMLVNRSSALFSKIIEAPELETAKSFFRNGVSDYWTEHYHFGKKAAAKTKNLGEMSINLIFINAIIPVLFVYSRNTGHTALQDKALGWLEEIKAENNTIVRMWNKMGVFTVNALESQALIQLYQQYCRNSRCLDCRFGIKLIQSEKI